ncbi:diguanylate cyclase [Ornithinibacillus sp. 179-J 7C1 HS]|uniref:diguanylate cyclase n=1 Tax=Ornithinibacillus sp. 179-J 7C1 HS TaxID=3142384 RepID=UPI00399F1491
MEIINNRYRLKELLKQERHVMVYSAYDMRNENRIILLNLLNTEYLPKSIIDFFINRFLEIKSLTSKAIIKNYSFNTVSYIDNKLQADPQYFFTSDYIVGTKDLFHVTYEMNFKEIIECFIKISTAVYYLHSKGFIYSSLNRHSIQLKVEDGDYQVLLKDIATVQMERLTHREQLEDSAYIYPKVLAGMPEDEESDIYSLGVILLAMLTKKPSLNDPRKELALLKETTDPNITKIIPVLENLLNTDNEYSYQNLYELIVDLNNALETNYSIINKEEFDGLNLYTKLVGRDEHIEEIVKAYDKMISYQPGKRIFFVQGASGVGKTRFLQEINFLLDLSKASVYSSFSLNNASADSKEMWIDILRKLIMETDNSIVEKYKTELMKYFPELMDKNYASSLNYTNEQNMKYRLLNRIAGFVNESIQNHPAVMIIDNIHLADDFTIDTFNYLCTEVLENTNLTLIFSCTDSEISPNSVGSEFIYNMKRRSDSETIRLEQLDEKHTGEMIKSILSISFTPKKISRRIYRQSYGNPLFITEIMKDLYSRRVIYISDETGRWQIDLPEESGDYNLLDLPDNIEHALMNQLTDLDPYSQEILRTVSIFSKPVSADAIATFLSHNEHLNERLEDLIKKGILQRLIGDSSYLYDFRTKVLKKIVYDKIDEEERVVKHQLAATSLEEHIDLDNSLDELIYHFTSSKNFEKARTYYIEKAEQMKVSRNTKKQIENLQKALEITENRKERIKLNIEIGDLLTDTGETNLAFKYLETAEEHAIESGDKKLLLETYLVLSNTSLLSYDNTKLLGYIDKVENIINYFPSKAAELEIKRIRAVLLTEDNQIFEAREMFEELIEECGDQYKKIKGNAYRTLGFIYVQLGKADMALEMYHQSSKLLGEINNARGILFSLNNIGALYAEVYDDFDKAMEYHLQVKSLSEEYGIYTSEVFALINIAESYLNQYDFDTAFDHFNLALTKAERHNLVLEKYMLLNYLTQVSLERNNFADALDYFQKLKKDLHDNPNKGFDISNYYQTCARVYQALGNYFEAERYNQKIIHFHSEHENILKYTATVDVLINQLQGPGRDFDDYLVKQILIIAEKITNKAVNIERLCEAIQHLGRKGKYNLTQLLLSKVDGYITQATPYRLRAVYEHAKGIVEFGVNRENSISYLERSLHLAKKSKNKELTARIQADLGNSYFVLEKYYDAAYYYLEGLEGVKELIQQLPDEYKLDYINGRNFSKEFYRLAEIKKWLESIQENILDTDAIITKVTSLEELESVLNVTVVDDFIENQQFMQKISSKYMEKLSDGILRQEDLFKHLDSDVSKNLKMIVKFLAGRLLATKGYIIAEEKGQELTVLSSVDGSNGIPDNVSIFNRVRSTMKPSLLSGWANDDKLEPHFLPDDRKAVLCIPIIKRLESQPLIGENQQILGYIYLETDRIVNNFNQQGLKNCMQLVNFLVLLLEKRQLTISASIDKLTGALTRKYLEDALQNTLEFTRKNGNEFSIIMFDLDKFKGVNDRYGHQIGDKILREVSQIILNHLDQNSFFGRYGGEEFIIILPSVKVSKAKEIAEKLRSTVQSQKLLGDKHEVTLSMGLASYPEHGQTVRELILKADQALYMAKENGRNNSQVWQKDFEDNVKPANKLTGIISGDEIRDARNVLALVELIQLTNESITVEEKIYQFLGRMIEIIEAQYGYILLADGETITQTYGRKSQDEDWVVENTFNQKIISTVMKEVRGIYTIDWEATEKINTVNGLPDWDSILAVPITTGREIKGVMYISVPARLKEFGADELNVLNVYSELVANII